MRRIDDLIEPCRAILEECAKSGRNIAYGELAERLGLASARQQWNKILDPIYERDIAEGRVPLTLVVVSKKTGVCRYHSKGKPARSVLIDPNNLADVDSYEQELAALYKCWKKSSA